MIIIIVIILMVGLHFFQCPSLFQPNLCSRLLQFGSQLQLSRSFFECSVLFAFQCCSRFLTFGQNAERWSHVFKLFIAVLSFSRIPGISVERSRFRANARNSGRTFDRDSSRTFGKMKIESARKGPKTNFQIFSLKRSRSFEYE